MLVDLVDEPTPTEWIAERDQTRAPRSSLVIRSILLVISEINYEHNLKLRRPVPHVRCAVELVADDETGPQRATRD